MPATSERRFSMAADRRPSMAGTAGMAGPSDRRPSIAGPLAAASPAGLAAGGAAPMAAEGAAPLAAGGVAPLAPGGNPQQAPLGPLDTPLEVKALQPDEDGAMARFWRSCWESPY
ncbi:collagen alpha-2(I) chain-like [Ornithodoros turicata]|uniref:collagen alpha-2(I) chain-like n=1 Tax=Ornithodoros turicata TaxID=34597 RepID=UPI003139D32F